MSPSSLPLELQQQIFSLLDIKSFYSARRVCRWWYFASAEATTLTRQLMKLPLRPHINLAQLRPQELHSLFNEAGQKLLLGTRATREEDIQIVDNPTSGLWSTNPPRVTATSNGYKTVTINNRTIALFDTSTKQAKILTQRPLNDLGMKMGNGPWLNTTATSNYKLALSSDSRLLAVAEDRTIQVYDLSDSPDSATANHTVSSPYEICRLDFDMDDRVLKLCLGTKGVTMYLGTPPQSAESLSKQGIEYWQSSFGLSHVFLDSSLFKLATSTRPDDRAAWVSGLQLLRPVRDGYLFGAQKHGGGESSHYILGHVKCSPRSEYGHSFAAQQNSVVELVKLESFLSNYENTLTNNNIGSENGMALWENMPSAHEHHPRFALSLGCDLLIVAEREKKRVRPMKLTQIFVYRLPGMGRVLKAIDEAAVPSLMDVEMADVDPTEVYLESGGSDRKEGFTVDGVKTYSGNVPRVPLCLGTIEGEGSGIVIERVNGGVGVTTHVVKVSVGGTEKLWRLEEW